MKLWKVIVLLNLAVALGLGLGYLRWGRAQARLRAELDVLAARSVTATAGEWTTRGVVRAVLPDLGVIVLTHGAIGDVMPPMTMGFRVSAPSVPGLEPGDEVQFTARGAPPNLVMSRIEKLQ